MNETAINVPIISIFIQYRIEQVIALKFNFFEDKNEKQQNRRAHWQDGSVSHVLAVMAIFQHRSQLQTVKMTEQKAMSTIMSMDNK